MTFKTINDGEQALILNNRGRARVVVGPQRVSFEIDQLREACRTTVVFIQAQVHLIVYSLRCGWLGTKRLSIFLAMLLAKTSISSSNTEMDERNTLLGKA